MKFSALVWATACAGVGLGQNTLDLSAAPSKSLSPVVSSTDVTSGSSVAQSLLDASLSSWRALGSADYHFSYQLRDPFEEYSWAPINFVSVVLDGYGDEQVSQVVSSFGEPVSEPLSSFPTILDLFDTIQLALDRNADHVEVIYHEIHGYPTFLNISSDGFYDPARRLLEVFDSPFDEEGRRSLRAQDRSRGAHTLRDSRHLLVKGDKDSKLDGRNGVINAQFMFQAYEVNDPKYEDGPVLDQPLNSPEEGDSVRRSISNGTGKQANDKMLNRVKKLPQPRTGSDGALKLHGPKEDDRELRNKMVKGPKNKFNSVLSLRGPPSYAPSEMPSSAPLEKNEESYLNGLDLPPFVVVSVDQLTPFDVLQNQYDAARKLWSTMVPLGNYTMTYQRVCFCLPSYVAKRTVVVSFGAVESVTITEVPVTSEELESITEYQETVEDVFTIIQNAITGRAASIDVTYDDSLGYPSLLRIDWSIAIADEEVMVVIEDVVV